MSKDIEEIAEDYAKELLHDSILDDTRLREIELKIPGIKAKWATYRSINNARLYKLNVERNRLVADGVKMIVKKREAEGNPVSQKGAEYMLKHSEQYLNLTQRIDKLEFLANTFTDYLYVIKGITYDVKNLVETIKVDEM